jgi:predicted RND superfamily exporter protein
MQFLSVFIVLGVGADDIFVLVDAWKQSLAFVPHQGSEEATRRMRLKYSMTRTAQAVFNTSFTTAAAFFATAVSPIMPIATFGIFSA